MVGNFARYQYQPHAGATTPEEVPVSGHSLAALLSNRMLEHDYKSDTSSSLEISLTMSVNTSGYLGCFGRNYEYARLCSQQFDNWLRT